MTILQSKLLNQFNEIIFGFSTKIWKDEQAPYYFNMSLSVGDDERKVKENRKAFFSALGLKPDHIVFQKQVHGDVVKYVDKPGHSGESDALITDKTNLGLAVSVADCTPIFIFDKVNKVIAGVHSGWRSTEKQILLKTLEKMRDNFGTKPNNLYAFIGPSIDQKNYEVGKEVAELFDTAYSIKSNNKFLLNVKQANYDMLVKFGVPVEQIEISNLCTYESKNLLHSYRRDGLHSGRSLGVIALRQMDENR